MLLSILRPNFSYDDANTANFTVKKMMINVKKGILKQFLK